MLKPDTDDPLAEQKPAPAGYRQRALTHYESLLDPGMPLLCSVCGFGIRAVLEVAHIDQKRSNNDVSNLAVLCPTCHKMFDIGLIPDEVLLAMRDRKLEVNWSIRNKDAHLKASNTRKAITARRRKSEAGKKAWATKLKKRTHAAGDA